MKLNFCHKYQKNILQLFFAKNKPCAKCGTHERHKVNLVTASQRPKKHWKIGNKWDLI